jgi:transposase-like protein
MDQDQSEAGQELTGEPERTPEQVREEIEQTRIELGDTVAALAQKTDVKAQAKRAVDEAKETVTGKVSGIRDTVTVKRDEFVSGAQEATPESASEAGQRMAAFARENKLLLSVLAAFGLGLLVGRLRAR